MTERKDVQIPIETGMKRHGWIVKRLQMVGLRGWPDITGFRKGRVLCVECKLPGELASPQQLKIIQELKENGFDAIIADCWEDVAPFAGVPD